MGRTRSNKPKSPVITEATVPSVITSQADADALVEAKYASVNEGTELHVTTDGMAFRDVNYAKQYALSRKFEVFTVKK